MRSTARQRMNRVLPRGAGAADGGAHPARADAPRSIGRVVVDFTALSLPADVGLALAEAFWNHCGARSGPSVLCHWRRLKVFARFILETHALRSLSDVSPVLLVRYIEWLNAQCDADGAPWSKTTRAARYTTLCRLLQWLERCRPGLWDPLEYPFNPFPWRNRDNRPRTRLSAQDLHAILTACQHEIAQSRALRERGRQERAAAAANTDPAHSLGAMLACIDRSFDGVLPSVNLLQRRGHMPLYRSLSRYGGMQVVESYLYPSPASMLPYYLAILLHTAGNPEAIADLQCDCLQPIPLLEDRVGLVWNKPRAAVQQRRAFRSTDAFEPPALVREILQWTHALRPHVRAARRTHLFLAKNANGVRALSRASFMAPLQPFVRRHRLPPFSFASIRPSVLTAIYRASGDLQQVKAVANHAHLSTTVGYLEGPQVEAQNRARVATLQSAFLGHFSPSSEGASVAARALEPASRPEPQASIPSGQAVSMFGFGCTDPFAGIAPGTHRGELCTNFLGCLTCPNAIIARDPHTIARLLQARDHLRAAAAQLHPARWEAVYAPPLRILEQDVLSGFSAHQLAQGERLRGTLPSLPPLR